LPGAVQFNLSGYAVRGISPCTSRPACSGAPNAP
jgi:hypothetical protein